jgi:hypothetical protein
MPVKGGPDDVNDDDALADILDWKDTLMNREERRVNDYICKLNARIARGSNV